MPAPSPDFSWEHKELIDVDDKWWQTGILRPVSPDAPFPAYAAVHNIAVDEVFIWVPTTNEEGNIKFRLYNLSGEAWCADMGNLPPTVSVPLAKLAAEVTTDIIEKYPNVKAALQVRMSDSDFYAQSKDDLISSVETTTPDLYISTAFPRSAKQRPKMAATLSEEEIDAQVEKWATELDGKLDPEAVYLAQEHFKEIVSRQHYLHHYREADRALDRLIVYQRAEIDLLTQEQGADEASSHTERTKRTSGSRER